MLVAIPVFLSTFLPDAPARPSRRPRATSTRQDRPIQALTRTDTDRLPEENNANYIDLVFGRMTLVGDRIGFVDVPGHERFVKNMLLCRGIDLVS